MFMYKLLRVHVGVYYKLYRYRPEVRQGQSMLASTVPSRVSMPLQISIVLGFCPEGDCCHQNQPFYPNGANTEMRAFYFTTFLTIVCAKSIVDPEVQALLDKDGTADILVRVTARSPDLSFDGTISHRERRVRLLLELMRPLGSCAGAVPGHKCMAQLTAVRARCVHTVRQV